MQRGKRRRKKGKVLKGLVRALPKCGIGEILEEGH